MSQVKLLILLFGLIASTCSWAQFNFGELRELLPENSQAEATNIYQLDPQRHINRVRAIIPRIREAQPNFINSARTFENVFSNGRRMTRTLDSLTLQEQKRLRNILKQYNCPMALPTGANDCANNDRVSNWASQRPRVVGLNNFDKEFMRQFGFSDAELDSMRLHEGENRVPFQQLLTAVDYRVQAANLNQALGDANALIRRYEAQQRDIDQRTAQISQACQTYLRSVNGKVRLSSANSSQAMPTNISASQARSYITQLSTSVNEAQLIQDSAERINRYQELRNAAEILACNGHRNSIASMIPELDDALKESIHTGNNDCNNADESDRLYSSRSSCIASFLDALPSGRGEFIANVEQVNRRLNRLDPQGVLDQLKEDQTRQARDNLEYMNALFHLDNGPKANLPPGTVTSSNCGGEDFNRAKAAYGQFITDLSRRNQFTAMSKEQREEALGLELGQFIERSQNAYPGFGALAYSPGFLSSYNLDLDDMSVEQNDVSCDDVKNEMKSTLYGSINFIRNPPQNRADQTIARATQTTKRFLSDYMRANTMGLVNIPTASYAEIDQLYREIPELQNYPREQIHHLKSLIKHRPEMRAQYMRQFEGNSRLICFLYKASQKDAIRDRIVQKEVKFVKAVAKGVGLALSVASFAVNPAMGMVLTAASMGATAVSHTATISNLQSQLEDVRNRQGVVLNNCIENMMRSPSVDQNLARSQCSDAVATAHRVDELATQLAGAESAAKMDAALYLVYVAQAAPHLLHEGHHGMALTEMFRNSRSAITAAQSSGAPVGRAILQSITSVAAHRPADIAYEVTKISKLAYYTYATAKYGSYLGYVNNEQHAYHYFLLDEQIEERRRSLGRGLNSSEVQQIEAQVSQRVERMSADQVRQEIGMINSGS